jgi:hypothetical protein
MIDFTKALISLRPNAEWSAVDNEVTWLDTTQTQPTEAEITAELTRLQAEYDSLAYARSRKQEYDKLPQFEMQFDDQRDGTSTWVDSINEIKERFPK